MLLSGWMLLLLAPCIGSWLGVLARRLPQGRPVMIARSACEHCHRVLAARDMVPLLSFLWLRGKCRYCGAPVGWFHLAIELAALAVAVAALCVSGAGWQGWATAALGWALLLAGWIDVQTFRLPDFITLPLILAGLLVTGLAQPEALYNHAAAAALGYLSFRLIDKIYLWVRGRQGLGAGDAKLLAGAGAWLGLAALPYIVFGAALIGIVMALAAMRGTLHSQRKIPFGPALALSFFLFRLLESALWV